MRRSTSGAEGIASALNSRCNRKSSRRDLKFTATIAARLTAGAVFETVNSKIEPSKKSAAMKSTDVPKKSRRGSAPGEYRGGGGNAPTKFKPEYVQIARVMAMEGLHNSAIARAFAVQPSTIVKWKNRHPAFAEALRAGDNETGKIVVSLAKAARGYKRKAVRPITVSNGNGFSKIIDHPVVEY